MEGAQAGRHLPPAMKMPNPVCLSFGDGCRDEKAPPGLHFPSAEQPVLSVAGNGAL